MTSPPNYLRDETNLTREKKLVFSFPRGTVNYRSWAKMGEKERRRHGRKVTVPLLLGLKKGNGGKGEKRFDPLILCLFRVKHAPKICKHFANHVNEQRNASLYA